MTLRTRGLFALTSLIIFGAACTSPAKKTATADAASLGRFNTEWLDSTVTPCQDFASFTSNGWEEMNPIPETEGRWGSFDLLMEENRRRLKSLLDDLSETDQPKGSYQQQVRDVYLTSMDTAAIEENASAEIARLLAPFNSLDERQDLPMIFSEMRKHGISMPWYPRVGPDDKNAGMNILQISQSGLGLPDRDYYLKEDEKSEEIRKAYVKHIEAMLKLADIDDAPAMAEAIFGLETRMAQMQMSRTDRRSPEKTYHKMSRAELQQLVPDFDMQAHLQALGFEGDTLLCSQPEYLKGMNALVLHEPLSVWKAYAQWHAINAYQEALPLSFRNEHFAFYGRTLQGKQAAQARWKVALQSIQAGLSEPLGRIYVDTYFPETHKQRIAEMVENIRVAYRERIEGLEWMGEQTKERAKQKLEAFTYKIGYPDEWKDHSDLEIGDQSMLQNLLRMAQYRFAENMMKADKPVDKSEWFMGAHIVNAYYNPSFNEIVFPAGILQPPFFDPDADDAFNYGAIGGVIGHEFTHGFDDQGSKYGPDGNLRNWWTEEDRARFDTLAKELSDQYSAYEALPGLFVNGDMTLGENIADLGGLTIAYYAYQNSLKDKPEPPVVQGITHEQRFFLGWAGVWQVHYTEEALRNRLLTDYHSPGHYRVNGPLKNMAEFQDAWGCSASNAKDDRIVIW